MLPALASAQCFESNFGTSIGTGDDVILAVTPMNITFPMGGIATSYTHIQPTTNGLAYLTNGVAAVGATGTGYSGTAATMVTNLRGLAGQNPRIAAYWRDLNMLAANNGGVFVNNTIAGKCVVTWKNAVHFGQTTPIFTVQAQLYSDGHVDMFYSATTQDTAIAPICGISAGNAIADPGATDLSVGATGVSTSQIVYQTFATLNTFDLQNTTVTFTPNAGGGYDTAAGSCVPASNTNYGGGCYDAAKESVYENFATSAAFDLANNSLTLTPTGTGYIVSLGGGTFVAPVSPTVLVLTDDSETTSPALTTGFPYPGGVAGTLTVCSNGFISVATGNGTGFSPSAATFLAAPQTGWWAWHDYNPGATGSGQVKFEEVSGIAYVTWDGVYNFGGTTAADASTVQWQFNESTGGVVVVFGTMTATGNGFLVGYSPGGPSLDPGSIDLTAALPVVTSPDLRALALSAAPAPVLAATVTYTMSNIRANLSLSCIFVSFGQTAPVPMPTLGFNSPGCFSLLDTNPLLGYGAASTLLLTNPNAAMNVTIPNLPIWSGVDIYFQGASLSPADSPSGVITTNGVHSRTSSF